MCFSSTASFGAAIALAIIGVASIRAKTSVKQTAFCIIPIVFSIQQIAEGFIWLSFTDAHYLVCRQWCAYIFLTCAYVIWPILIPFAILKIENKKRNIQSLSFVYFIGIATSIVYLISMLVYPVESLLVEHHIKYILHYPSWVLIIGSVCYGVATVVPAFISSVKKVWILGLLVALSYIITSLYFREYVISVWCYFAALISGVVFIIIKDNGYSTKKIV